MRFQAKLHNQIHQLHVAVEDDYLHIRNEANLNAKIKLANLASGLMRCEIDGEVMHIVAEVDKNGTLKLLYKGNLIPIEIERHDVFNLREILKQHAPAEAKFVEITALMPGLIVDILVHEGDSIEENQTLLHLEAMKMENEVRSPIKGIIKEIKVKPRDAVEINAVMMVVE